MFAVAAIVGCVHAVGIVSVATGVRLDTELSFSTETRICLVLRIRMSDVLVKGLQACVYVTCDVEGTVHLTSPVFQVTSV